MKPIVAWMTAAALLAGPMLGCKSENKEAEVTEPAADSDEPFVLHLVEVTVREADRPGQQAGQTGQQAGQTGQQASQQGQQTGQTGQQAGQQDTTAAAARGQGTTGERAGAAGKAGTTGETTTAATAGQDEDEMKPLSHARKELRQLDETVDTLAPKVAENLEEAAAVGDFIEVTDGVRIAGKKQIELPRSVKVKMDAWDQTEADLTTRVCVSREGMPVNVAIIESSGFQEADEKVRETILNTWRYQPYRANGQPIPVCERITFRYQLPDADTTKPVLF